MKPTHIRRSLRLHSYRVLMDPQDQDGGIVLGMTLVDNVTGERFRQDVQVNSLRATHLLLRIQEVLYRALGVEDRHLPGAASKEDDDGA